jgi:hypothetical protein
MHYFGPCIQIKPLHTILSIYLQLYSFLGLGKIVSYVINLIKMWLVHRQVKRAKFVAIFFLALAARFNIVVNICHLLSYYFFELLPIFVILITSVLPHFN